MLGEYVLYSRKVTEYCKTTIMEKIKIIIHIKKETDYQGPV